MISQGIITPIAVAIYGQLIVWMDAGRDTVETAALNGIGRRVLVRLAHNTFIDFALFKVPLNVYDYMIILCNVIIRLS